MTVGDAWALHYLCLQETGPTLCGDEDSDPSLMAYLGATLQDSGGNPL